MSNIWFTSDEHYGHSNAIKFFRPQFKSSDEMNEFIIENHNTHVRRGDRVFHLGDFAWHTMDPKAALKIIKRLNGQHYLIRGNHDDVEGFEDVYARFVWVKDLYRLKIKGYPSIVLFHYAMRTWRNKEHGAWHLYGHSHNQLPGYGYSFDVGVDCWQFLPLDFEQVKWLMMCKDAELKGAHLEGIHRNERSVPDLPQGF